MDTIRNIISRIVAFFRRLYAHFFGPSTDRVVTGLVKQVEALNRVADLENEEAVNQIKRRQALRQEISLTEVAENEAWERASRATRLRSDIELLIR